MTRSSVFRNAADERLIPVAVDDAAPLHGAASRRWWLRLLLGMLLLAGLAASAVWVFRQTGRAPAELLDYAERRMSGHPKVLWIGGPLLDGLRSAFGVASRSDRMRQPFHVPPPPPRRGAEDVLPAESVPDHVRVWRVGPQGPLFRIADAARMAKDGDVVEIEAGDYRGDVAVWSQSRLTIRGVHGAARLYADGRSAEGKAIWVMRRGQFEVSNIDFIGARVSDRNGAGIRLESGSLRIRHCLFWGNELGLMTSNGSRDARMVLTIESSEFAYSSIPGHWAHNLYVGTIDALTVSGSYFHHADSGHLLKSRARVSDVLYSRFTDESGGRASYELNFPNGGVVRLVGNILQQQPGTENSTMIAYGEEGYRWPLNVLQMGSNTLVNDLSYGGTFVAVAPGAQRVISANNLLVGPGIYRVKDPLTTLNDAHAQWEDLVQPARQDYRLRRSTEGLGYEVPTGSDAEVSLVPGAQYRHPLVVDRLAGAPTVVGAEQRVGANGPRNTK